MGNSPSQVTGIDGSLTLPTDASGEILGRIHDNESAKIGKLPTYFRSFLNSLTATDAKTSSNKSTSSDEIIISNQDGSNIHPHRKRERVKLAILPKDDPLRLKIQMDNNAKRIKRARMIDIGEAILNIRKPYNLLNLKKRENMVEHIKGQRSNGRTKRKEVNISTAIECLLKLSYPKRDKTMTTLKFHHFKKTIKSIIGNAAIKLGYVFEPSVKLKILKYVRENKNLGYLERKIDKFYIFEGNTYKKKGASELLKLRQEARLDVAKQLERFLDNDKYSV